MGKVNLNELEAMEFLKKRLIEYNEMHKAGDKIILEREEGGTWHGYCMINVEATEDKTEEQVCAKEGDE